MDPLEIHRQALEAFNRRDLDAWLEHLDPEFENVPPGEWPETDTVQGPRAVWDLLTDSLAVWEHPTFEAAQVALVGDRVVARITGQVRGAASGATVTWDWWHVVTFRDGKALRMEWFAERDDAFAVAERGA